MIKLLTILAGVLFLFLCSCASMTEEERFEREDRLIIAREDFYRQKESCRKFGGTMQIRSRTLGELTYLDYKTARCR